MKSLPKDENPKILQTKVEKIKILKYITNNDNMNNYDEEEYNLDLLNQRMENNIENENNYENNDGNLNEEQNDENIYNNEVENNNEYLFEKIKDKLNEERIEDPKINNENEKPQKIETIEEEKQSDIYDLPLSLNNISTKINSKINEDINIKKDEKTESLNTNDDKYKNKKEENKENMINELNNNNIINNNEINDDNNKKELQQNKDNDIEKDILSKENDISMDNKQNEIQDFNNKNKQFLISSPIVNSQPNLNLLNNKIQPLKIPKEVKFGVDETGNPINIYNILKKNNSSEQKNKIIAFIIQKEGENNYLIDIKGNILQKTEDDYYLYKEGEEFIIIKDFDIQHPELRVYGHRKINYNALKSEKKTEKKQKNNYTCNGKNDKKEKENMNISFKSENFVENKNRSGTKDKSFREMNMSARTNVERLKEKNKYLFNNDIDEIILNSKSKNKSVIIKDNKIENIKKINFHKIKLARNENFDVQMNIWRQRYGKKGNFNENKIDRNYSFNISQKDKVLFRTDSILKMSLEKNKSKIPIYKNNYKSNRNSIIRPYDFSIENKNIFFQRNNNSYSNLIENPLLNNSSKENIDDFPKVNLIKKKVESIHKYKRNKTLQYINSKYKYINKDFNSLSNRNKDVKDFHYYKKDILLRDIQQKYKNKPKYDLNIFKLNNNSFDDNKQKNYYYENEEIKKHNINNYIYNNLRKINENKYINKKLGMRCSVLSNEANKAIKDFNIRHKQKESLKILNIENINNFRQFPTKIINRNINFNRNNYTYINQNQNENFCFNYNNDLTTNDYDEFKPKLSQNEIKNNKIEILKNNLYKINCIKGSNYNNYYRKIKHNFSKINNNNF